MLRWNSIHRDIPNCKRSHLNPDMESTKRLKHPSTESNFNYKGSKTLQNKFYKEEKILLFSLRIAALSGDKKSSESWEHWYWYSTTYSSMVRTEIKSTVKHTDLNFNSQWLYVAEVTIKFYFFSSIKIVIPIATKK